MSAKKMGRPTDNPKPYKIGVKLDRESKDILDAYCKQEVRFRYGSGKAGNKAVETGPEKMRGSGAGLDSIDTTSNTATA